MKYHVTYNRIESRTYTLSTSEIEAAVRDYVERHLRPLVPPASARQEIEVSFDGDKRPRGPYHPTDGIEYQPVPEAR